jgi:hypothetical protein
LLQFGQFIDLFLIVNVPEINNPAICFVLFGIFGIDNGINAVAVMNIITNLLFITKTFYLENYFFPVPGEVKTIAGFEL